MYISNHNNRQTPSVLRAILVFASTFAGNILVVNSAFAQPPSPAHLSPNPSDLRDAFAPASATVETPESFAQRVARNPALRQRYARHFGVSEDHVLTFFKTALVPYTLPAAKTLTTYGVTKSGTIYPVRTKLPRGTKVWATREGLPVLKWNCSNPLSAVLPDSLLKRSPQPSIEETTVIALKKETPGLTVPETFARVDSPILPDISDTLLPPFAEDTSIFSGATPPTAVFNSNTLPGIGDIVQTGAKFNPLWTTALIPLGLIVAQGGKGDTTENLPIRTGEAPPLLPPTGPSTPVPESDALNLFIGGGFMLGIFSFLLRQRKKSSQTKM